VTHARAVLTLVLKIGGLMQTLIKGLAVICLLTSSTAFASDIDDIIQAARNYLVSQHTTNEKLMAKALHPELAKRTFWQSTEQKEIILETSYDTMLMVAKTYNKSGDMFPKQPKIDIKVLDIDKRVASVKLTADDWIDYMHLVKTENNEWKIINVLWQYHKLEKHQLK